MIGNTLKCNHNYKGNGRSNIALLEISYSDLRPLFPSMGERNGMLYELNVLNKLFLLISHHWAFKMYHWIYNILKKRIKKY